MNILLKDVLHKNSRADILIEGSRFKRIALPGKIPAAEIPQGTEIVGCSRFAVLPAFYNAHTHAAMTLFRGVADDLPLMKWLSEWIWPMEKKLDAETVYAGSRLAILEMIKSGTVFFSDMYWFREATIRAAEEMGIRATVGVTFAEGLADDSEPNFEFLRAHYRDYSPRVNLAVMPHAVYTVGEKLFRRCADIAEELDLKLHLHLSETADEAVRSRTPTGGKSPVEYLDSRGILTPRTIAAHAVHLSDLDISILRERGVSVVHCPASNMKLASGSFRAQAVLDAGIRVALGTDGAASNNNLDMREEMKLAALLAKVTSGNPEDSKKAHSSDFTGNIEFNYKVHGFEDLQIHGSLGGEYTEGSQADYNTPYSYDNNYYGWNGQTRSYKYNIVGNIYAQYMHTFDIHNIDIMAGAEESHYHRNGSNWGQGTDPYLHTAYNVSEKSQNDLATRSTLLSYFGRFNYTLAERYMLTTTLRGDASSRFSKNNRWGFFPSVALAWKISEEKFMKNISWWNEFKFRVGWGQTGQQQLKDANGNDLDFAYAPLYVISNSNAQYPFGSTYYQTVRPNSFNPDLKWETTTTWNAGFDFGFLNNRITANVDGYYRKTKDLLNFVSIPIGTNFGSSLPEKIGSLKNYGVEFSVEARPIVTKDFTWSLTYNLSWNHNEVTKLLNGADNNYVVYNYNNKISRVNTTPVEVFKVGAPINAFYVYQQVYDKNGKPIEGVYVDRNGEGKINSSDKYIYKSPAADVFMGLTSKFIYKEWDFSFSLRAALNNYVYYDFLSDKASISPSGLYSNSAFRNTTNEAVMLGFTGTGASEYYLSDYFVRNASYLKCTNITLGYTFPALVKTASYTGLSGRLFATVQNPFIITKYDGLDPEVSSEQAQEEFQKTLKQKRIDNKRKKLNDEKDE